MAKVQNLIDDYLNSLNEAMAIHTKKATEELPFNRTELVEIVDITNRDKGWYIVWNGSAKYQAYSDNQTYSIGTKVYVDIPNNDYAGQKIIKGLYNNGTTANEYSYTYEMPLDSISTFGNNLLAAVEGNEYGLLANYNKVIKQDGEQSIDVANIAITSGYRYLGLGADFKTLLPETTMGDYGLKLTANLKDGGTEIFYLNTKDMVGNLYSFPSYVQQQKVFDISELNIDSIDIEFYQAGNFYNGEERFNGVIDKNHTLPDNILIKNIQLYYGDYKVTEENILKLTSDSLVYNSSLSEAFNSKEVNLEWWYTDKEVANSKPIQISSYDAIPSKLKNPKLYWYKYIDASITAPILEETQKEVSEKENICKFIDTNFPKNEREKYIYENVIYSELDIEIFNYFINNVFDEQFEEVGDDSYDYYYRENTHTIYIKGWHYLEELKTEYEKNIKENKTYLERFSNTALGENWCLIDTKTDLFTRIVKLDLTEKETKYKVYLEYGPYKTKLNDEEEIVVIKDVYDTNSSEYGNQVSEEIIFTNTADIGSEFQKKQDAIRIVCADGSEGIYASYDGTSGAAVNQNEPLTTKIFNVVCDRETGFSYLNDSDEYLWEIPTSSTMINIDEECYEEEELVTREHEIFQFYKGTIPYKATNIYIKSGQSQKYKIAPKFVRTATNNTVRCYVIQPTGVLIAELELTFSQFAYTGSDYTFSLTLGSLIQIENNVVKKLSDPVDNFIEVPMDAGTYREIEIKLYDIKGKEVSLTSDKKNDIINAWVNNQEEGFYSGRQNAANNLEFKKYNANEKIGIGVRPKITNNDMINAQVAEVSFPAPRSLEKFYSIILQANYVKEESSGEVILYNQILPLNFKVKHCDPSNPFLEKKNLVIQGPNYIVYEHTGGNPKTNPEYSYYTVQSIRAKERDYAEKAYAKRKKDISNKLKQLSLLIVNNSSEENPKIDGLTYKEWFDLYNTADADYQNELAKIELKEKVYTGINSDSFMTYGELKIAPGASENVRDNYPVLGQDGALLIKREYIDGLSREICYNLKQKTTQYNNSTWTPIIIDLCTMPLAILKNRFSVCGQNVWINNIELIPDPEATPSGTRGLLRAANPLVASGAIIDTAANVTNISETGKINSVLIGTILDSDNETTYTGLFGYHENEPVFAVKTDGTAFLGKIGRGRINFDGNGGTITSNAYEENPHNGTIIDLTNSSIDLKGNVEEDGSWVHIGAKTRGTIDYWDWDPENLDNYVISEDDLEEGKQLFDLEAIRTGTWKELLINPGSDDNDEVYFSINGKNGKRIVSIGDIGTQIIRDNNNYIDYEKTRWGNSFIQTSDFNRYTPAATKRTNLDQRSGLRIDLSNGNFESYSDFTIMSSDVITLDGNVNINGTLSINGTSLTKIETETGEETFTILSDDIQKQLKTLSVDLFKNTAMTAAGEEGAGEAPYLSKARFNNFVANDIKPVAANPVPNSNYVKLLSFEYNEDGNNIKKDVYLPLEVRQYTDENISWIATIGDTCLYIPVCYSKSAIDSLIQALKENNALSDDWEITGE